MQAIISDLFPYICPHPAVMPQEEEEDMVGALQPFQFMLQILLQPLLQPGAGEPAAAALPLILKIARTLKRTEDGGVRGGLQKHGHG